MDAQWLKYQFDCNPTKSKAGLAEVLKLEPPAVSKILNGARQVKAHEYQEMRRYFGLPVDGEHATKNSLDQYRLETLSEKHSMQEDLKPFSDDSWVIPASIMSKRTNAQPDQIKIFQINDNLMEPDHKRDEQVLIDLSDKSPSPPGAFIVSDGFGYMLRFCEFVPQSEPARVKVSAMNDRFQTQILDFEDFNIIGRAIAKLQWL